MEDVLARVASLRGGSAVVGFDIGGTNSRMLLRVAGGAGEQQTLEVHWKCNSTRTLLAELTQIQTTLAAGGVAVVGAAMAIAGPVNGGCSVPAIVNFEDGEHSSLHLDELPRGLFPLHRTRLLNDMSACAEGVLTLSREAKLHEGFEVLFPAARGRADLAVERSRLSACTYVLVAVGESVPLCVAMYRATSHATAQCVGRAPSLEGAWWSVASCVSSLWCTGRHGRRQHRPHPPAGPAVHRAWWRRRRAHALPSRGRPPGH
jgi:hypothetical protein